MRNPPVLQQADYWKKLKNKIQQSWWREMVYRHQNIVGVDAGILMNPEVWVASGHVGAFSDPLVECTNCHRRFRTDELEKLEAGNPDDQQCPSCGTTGNWRSGANRPSPRAISPGGASSSSGRARPGDSWPAWQGPRP